MKHFKNITSYKDLKDKYRKLLKENHPDNGGNLETMQDINCEYDVLFAIWKDKATKENKLTDEEKTETAQSTKRTFYTAYGWEGSRYDSNLSLKEIAKIARTYVKEKYPTCKFSIRTHYASMCQSLSVDLLEFPEQMYKTAEQLKECYYETHSYINDAGETVTYDVISDEILQMRRKLYANWIFRNDSWTQEELLDCYTKTVFEENQTFYGIETEYFKAVIDDVNTFIASYNYDDSDGMIDYFDVNFYDGKVDYRSCKYVPKVARIKNKESMPATKKEAEKENTIMLEENDLTITESEHTKTHEKLYLVKCNVTLDRESYKTLNDNIKKLGGYYSRFTHSFIFKNDPTEALKELKVS